MIFEEHTKNSEVAKELRKMIQTIKPWTQMNVKIVERVGQKLQDILCKSDPWDNTDCKRSNCLSCESVVIDDKLEFKSCFKRSVVYQTWCDTCLKKKEKVDEDIVIVDPNQEADTGEVDESKEIKEDYENEDKMDKMEEVKLGKNRDKIRNEKRELEEDTENGLLYTYIGETSRSIFERSKEHKKDLEFRRPKSHMLRHCFEVHPELDPEKVDFRMKILTSHKSAFERQIREAVMIDHHSKDKLLNSKMEQAVAELGQAQPQLS